MALPKGGAPRRPWQARLAGKVWQCELGLGRGSRRVPCQFYEGARRQLPWVDEQA